jgi:hypothetical protein
MVEVAGVEIGLGDFHKALMFMHFHDLQRLMQFSYFAPNCNTLQ